MRTSLYRPSTYDTRLHAQSDSRGLRHHGRSVRTWLSLLLASMLVSSLIGAPTHPAHAAPLNDCATSDNGDPTLTSFARTPAHVDVTAASKRVFFTLKVADLGGPGPATGLSRVLVGFGQAPSPDEFIEPHADLKPNAAGAWVGSLLVPRWRKPGRVRLGVTMFDMAGNYRFLEPADLAAAGFPTEVMVTSTPDTTAPKLTSMRITPTLLDTRRSPRTLTITATARDTQSGVARLGVSGLLGSQALTRDPDGSIHLTRVAGTANAFRGTVRVPRWVGAGTWKVYQVWVEDRIGNLATYSYRRLGRLGFDRSLEVLSRRDTGRPAVRRLSLDPTAVDVRETAKRVIITLRAVDPRSGVHSAWAFFLTGDGGTGGSLRRVGGTRRDGIWRGVFSVDRCAPLPGALRLIVDVTDGSGNTKTYRGASLTDNGWPSRVAVTANDHVIPTAFVSEVARRAGPIRVGFSENVNGIDADSMPVHRVFDTGDEYANGPVVPGTWVCSNGPQELTNCETGRVRIARFTPTDPLAASDHYGVTTNPEFSLAVTDLAGNPIEREQHVVQAPR